MPALDGLRGVAIAAVIGQHYFKLAAGFYGVDLFFVLSGFLITTLLIQEHDRAGGISLRRFYGRRARRLAPAAGAFLVAVAVLESGGGADHVLRVVAEGGLYACNVFRGLVSGDAPGSTPLAHFWSLAQEEQFYLLWPPLLVLLVGRFGIRRRAFFGGLVAVAAALALYRLALIHDGASWFRVYFAPDAHADGIVLGCAIAFVRVRVGKVLPLVALAVFVASASIGAATTSARWDGYGLGLLAVELAACTLVLGALEAGPLAAILSARPLVWLGGISYSLYIWQQLPIYVLHYHRPLIGLPFAVVLALLSYRFIEAPFRRPRPERPPVAAAAAAAS